MVDVLIKKSNNLYIKIIAEDHIRMGLSEAFTRYAKGYRFNPKFKAGIWDGKIRLFNFGTGEVYFGLIKKVIEYCQEMGFIVKVDNEVKQMFKSDFKMIDEYLKNEVLAKNGKQIHLRDYQEKVIRTCLEQKKRLIKSPTNSGKSSMIYCISKYLIEHEFDDNERILIIVPTTGLVSQFYNDYIDYSSLNGFDVKSLVGKVGAGNKEHQKKIVISTWQSIYKMPKEYFDSFKCLFVDEVHGATAKSLIDICKKCDAEFRFGLSGSIDEEDDITELTLTGLFGFKLVATTTQKMIENKQSAKLDIQCIHLKYNKEVPKQKLEYQKELKYVVMNDDRNKFIIDVANSLEGNTLILFQYIEHGKDMYEKAKKENKEVFFVYGGVAVDERESIRNIAEHHKGCIIIASYKTFSTGINITSINSIIFASPLKAFNTIIQSIGRGLRVNSTKNSCKLVDIVDHVYGDVKNVDKTNFLFKHFLERIKIYIREGHQYTVDQVLFDDIKTD